MAANICNNSLRRGTRARCVRRFVLETHRARDGDGLPSDRPRLDQRVAWASADAGKATRYCWQLGRYAAAFALAVDIALLTLGGALKRKETISGRFADIRVSSIRLGGAQALAR